LAARKVPQKDRRLKKGVIFEYTLKLFFMSETNQSFTDKANALKDQATEKLGELKEKAGELTDSLKQKAGEAWDKVNTEENKEKLQHLKDQASEKLDEAEEKIQELAGKAKGLWDKVTGHHDDPAAGSPKS
jgi:uncharacterized protein YjbJ (UPF0337 family)